MSAPGDDLVAQATAALEGVTEGPWTADVTDPSDVVVWGQEAQTGDDYLIGNVASARVQNVAVVFDVDTANARFIAFARQWVPEAAARISALTATVVELQKERDKISKTAVFINQTLGDVAVERDTLRDRLARMEKVIPPLIVIAEDNLDGMNAETREECERDIAAARAALTDGGKHG